MNIIIAGNGRVGATLTKQLVSENHDITVIDRDADILKNSAEKYDVITLQGNCASMTVLRQASIQDADLLIAATNSDAVNLLCCTTAHNLNPKLHTIARVRDPEYTEQIYAMRDVFGLSMSINPEKQTAVEIDRLLKYPGFLRRDTFAKGRTEIVELKIDSGSKLCNVRLADLRSIVKCQVLVCAVIRGGNAIAPKGDFVLLQGDRLLVTALTANLSLLLSNLGIITRRINKVMLCGCGTSGYYLAELLLKEGIRLTIVEKDADRAQELAELLPDANILEGDASDQTLLEEEGIERCDAIVTMTGSDELNMVTSMYAAACNVPQIITKLNHTRNRKVVEGLSLGSVICPKELSSNTIVRYVRAFQNQKGAALSVHAIAEGAMEALEFEIDEHARFQDTPLKMIRLKPDVLLVGITHGTSTAIPDGNSSFTKGDTVVVVTGSRKVMQFNDIFA